MMRKYRIKKISMPLIEKHLLIESKAGRSQIRKSSINRVWVQTVGPDDLLNPHSHPHAALEEWTHLTGRANRKTIALTISF
jgi:hypothetical protein